MPTSSENWTWQCDQVIPNDPAEGRRLLDVVLQHLEAANWTRREIFGVHLAVAEAIDNAAVHGNALDQAKHIHFRCWLSPEKVRVEVTDEGPGFDPHGLPNPTDPPHIDRPRGRGVMLMRAFMSRVEFSEPGNRVVLEKDRRSEHDCG